MIKRIDELTKTNARRALGFLTRFNRAQLAVREKLVKSLQTENRNLRRANMGLRRRLDRAQRMLKTYKKLK